VSRPDRTRRPLSFTLVLHLLRLLASLLGGHRQLALENLALRQQLAVYKRLAPRPKPHTTDRLFCEGQEIMAVLGRRDPRMTVRYQHLTPERLRDTMRALEAPRTGTISAPAGEGVS
jgi:hypothetical protein